MGQAISIYIRYTEGRGCISPVFYLFLNGQCLKLENNHSFSRSLYLFFTVISTFDDLYDNSVDHQ